MIIPKGFLPSEDIEQINGTTEAVEGISFDAMAEHQKQIGEILAKDPSIAYVMSGVGTGGRTMNQGNLNIRLKPRSQRPQVDQVMAELRPKLAAVPGITTFLRNDPPIRIGGLQSKALYQFTIQSPNTRELYASAQDFTAKMIALPGLTDVSSDLQIRNPQINVQINRDAASAYGVSANQIEDALYSAYGQRQISTIFAPNNQYFVILELEPEYQRDANAISLLYVHAKTGQLVPLNAVAKLTPTLGPSFGEPPWAGTRGYDFLQFEARLLDWRRGDGDQRTGAPFSAGGDKHHVPGQRAGVSIVAFRPGAAAGHGDFGDLHHPGHSVRELHSPAHHPVRTAFGRLRGAARTLFVSHCGAARHRVAAAGYEPGHLRLCRHHHADRHRKEKRHHDDRLRAGGAAQRGQEPGGGHLPRLPGQVPAHHDDHHGRADGHLAYRAGLRRWRRITQAPGHLGSRRAGFFAVCYAVPDARRLHLHGAG